MESIQDGIWSTEHKLDTLYWLTFHILWNRFLEMLSRGVLEVTGPWAILICRAPTCPPTVKCSPTITAVTSSSLIQFYPLNRCLKYSLYWQCFEVSYQKEYYSAGKISRVNLKETARDTRKRTRWHTKDRWLHWALFIHRSTWQVRLRTKSATKSLSLIYAKRNHL